LPQCHEAHKARVSARQALRRCAWNSGGGRGLFLHEKRPSHQRIARHYQCREACGRRVQWLGGLVSDRKGHMVEIKRANAPIECLSEAEIQLVDEVYQEHGGMDQWQLREWCHLNCGEWTPMHGGRNTISVEEIAKNVGKSDAETQQIVEEAEESNLLGSVFSMKRPAHV